MLWWSQIWVWLKFSSYGAFTIKTRRFLSGIADIYICKICYTKSFVCRVNYWLETISNKSYVINWMMSFTIICSNFKTLQLNKMIVCTVQRQAWTVRKCWTWGHSTLCIKMLIFRRVITVYETSLWPQATCDIIYGSVRKKV